MSGAGFESFALSVTDRGTLGGLLILVWLVGEAVILARARLSVDRAWLPTALLRSLWGRRGNEDRGSGAAVLGSFYIWALVTWASLALTFGTLPWYAFYPGLVSAMVGIGVRFWALAVLGRHFSVVVVTSADQTLVRTGPYRRVRHPSYTGVLLITAGVAALLLSGPGLLVGFLVVAAAFGYRIHVEEAALLSRFGREYAEYRRTTWRLVPYLV